MYFYGSSYLFNKIQLKINFTHSIVLSLVVAFISIV